MKTSLRRRPSLEVLEDRCVPSVTITDDANGNLLISGNIPGGGTLTINENLPQSFQITTSDGEYTAVPFTVLGTTTVNMTGDVTTNVTLNGNNTPGPLNMTFN